MPSRLEKLMFFWIIAISIVLVPVVVKTFSRDTKVEMQKETSTTVTPTTFLGVKCMVNGFVVHTDLQHARAAGCK